MNKNTKQMLKAIYYKTAYDMLLKNLHPFGNDTSYLIDANVLKGIIEATKIEINELNDEGRKDVD